MKKEDFIDKHYYKCILSGINGFYYFKYCEKNYMRYDGNQRLNYYYNIFIDDNFILFKDKDIKVLFTIDYDYKYEEVELSDIIDYLPIGHPDRILYRNNRIKSLLS